MDGELSDLLPPSPSSDGKAGMTTSASGSSLPLPLHTAGQILGLTVRRAHRKTSLLLSAVKNTVTGPSKPHEPMTSWGCFLFLSNLCVPGHPPALSRAADARRPRRRIMGPGILGLPAAYRHSGVLAATLWTCAFAAASVLACVFIAHATRIYRVEVRLRAAGVARRGPN